LRWIRIFIFPNQTELAPMEKTDASEEQKFANSSVQPIRINTLRAMGASISYIFSSRKSCELGG
jgi:hypothetical protein